MLDDLNMLQENLLHFSFVFFFFLYFIIEDQH